MGILDSLLNISWRLLLRKMWLDIILTDLWPLMSTFYAHSVFSVEPLRVFNPLSLALHLGCLFILAYFQLIKATFCNSSHLAFSLCVLSSAISNFLSNICFSHHSERWGHWSHHCIFIRLGTIRVRSTSLLSHHSFSFN